MTQYFVLEDVVYADFDLFDSAADKGEEIPWMQQGFKPEGIMQRYVDFFKGLNTCDLFTSIGREGDFQSVVLKYPRNFPAFWEPIVQATQQNTFYATIARGNLNIYIRLKL